MTDQADWQAILERNTLFELILENAGDVLWTYDFLLDRYTYASPSVFMLRGYTPDEVRKQSLFEALTPDSAAKARNLVTKRKHKLEQGDLSARLGVNVFEQFRKDGTSVMTEVMTTFVTNNAGKVTGIVGIARDISKRLEEDQQRNELEKKLYESHRHESINRIVGGVAHELNNKLMPVSGYAELLGDLLQDNDEVVEYSRQIYLSVKRASGLIDQLLDYTGAQHLKLKYVDLNHAITSFEHLLRSAIKENIVIEIRHDGTSPLVRMDFDKLRQIVINLAFNAQDAMPDGGHLTLEISTIKLDKASADQLKMTEGNYAHLIVSDTGSGIDPSIQENIFEPFFTTKKFGMASGLGLSAAYGIVQQHHGTITVASEVGNGTSASIVLPLFVSEEDANRSPNPEPALAGETTKTIMLVEDDDHVRGLIHQLLTRQGYSVLQAANAKMALERAGLHAGTIDLLITDIIMPGMNGKQLADELQARYPSIHTIFISGYSNNIIQESVQLPAKCHFMQKPFPSKELIRLVTQLLEE